MRIPSQALILEKWFSNEIIYVTLGIQNPSVCDPDREWHNLRMCKIGIKAEAQPYKDEDAI